MGNPDYEAGNENNRRQEGVFHEPILLVELLRILNGSIVLRTEAHIRCHESRQKRDTNDEFYAIPNQENAAEQPECRRPVDHADE